MVRFPPVTCLPLACHLVVVSGALWRAERSTLRCPPVPHSYLHLGGTAGREAARLATTPTCIQVGSKSVGYRLGHVQGVGSGELITPDVSGCGWFGRDKKLALQDHAKPLPVCEVPALPPQSCRTVIISEQATVQSPHSQHPLPPPVHAAGGSCLLPLLGTCPTQPLTQACLRVLPYAQSLWETQLGTYHPSKMDTTSERHT